MTADSETEVEAKFPNNRWQVDAADATGTGRHDASGNVTSASGSLFEYDAENRLVKVTVGSVEYRYRYDGDGRRVAVEKWTGGTQDSAYTRRFVYGVGGELLAEIQGSIPTSWETKYLGQDHLGSTRVVMKASGVGDGVVASRHDHYPFGEELPGRGLNYGDPLLLVKYTGHERDAETGLDFMQARYYGSGLGRFLSPDGPLVDQQAGDPQSWNLYSYVRNNPMALVDPTGMTADEDPNHCAGPFCVLVKAAPILVDVTLAEAGKNLKKIALKIGDEAEKAYENVKNFEVPYAKDICKGISAAGGAAGFALFTGKAGALASAPSGGTLTIPMTTGGLLIGAGVGYGFGNVYCNSFGGGNSPTGGGGGSKFQQFLQELDRLEYESQAQKISGARSVMRRLGWEFTEDVLDDGSVLFRGVRREGLRIDPNGTMHYGISEILEQGGSGTIIWR